MADPGQASGNDTIFRQDDADMRVRAAGAYCRTFKRIYEIQWGQTTSNADLDAIDNNLKSVGVSNLKWYVIPLDSALRLSIMPRQWNAIMQDARRVRTVNANIHCHAFSPYITTTTQNIDQITSILTL